FFQAEDGIRDWSVTGVQTCALPISPQAKEVFAQPRNDPNLTIVAGGLLDVARRSPFLCGAFYRDQDKLIATVRMPRGREGMPPEIGRASCRGRAESAVGGAAYKNRQ